MLCPQLFQRLDFAKLGSIQLSQITRYFRGQAHPEVAGSVERRTAQQVEAELVELFQVKRTPAHGSHMSQLISWAVSEGEGKEKGSGASSEWFLRCLLREHLNPVQEFEDFFEGQSIDYPSEEHFNAVVKTCWAL